jgi:hypothetical protein
MIVGKADDPVTKGEFYSGMFSVFLFLFAVHSTADAWEIIRVLILLLLVGGIILWGVAWYRARRRSRASND